MNMERGIRGRALLAGVLATALLIAPGCGSNDFLGLEDYQRDLLGGLAAALLGQQLGTGGDDPAGQPIPGADGLNCWDLNGNGQDDEEEDFTGDGVFDARDCQGPPGPAGADGQAGADGVPCWDLDGDGAGDPEEDINDDGVVDISDCRGAAGSPGDDGQAGPRGPEGPRGPVGPPGQDGPEFFHVFVDDFFTYAPDGPAAVGPESWLPVGVVRVDEPVLQDGPVAYRVAIPPHYGARNDVTMRIFLFRTGVFEGDCSVLTVDARRLRNGTGVEIYEHAVPVSPVPGRRWVRVDGPGDIRDTTAGNGVDLGTLVMIDLPLNRANGLSYPDDLADGDFLAFELDVHQEDGRYYQLLGVEFDESGSGSARRSGATVFLSPDDVTCGFIDCNGNGRPDSLDIAEDLSHDCNGDGVPDECAACPPLDLVFLMDTSGSMADEGIALCESINGIVADLAGRGIELNPEILAIAPNDEGDLPPCVAGTGQSVEARFDNQVPGDNGACPATLTAGQNSEKDENWASATAIVAERYPWATDAIRVIVPVSDEGACLGDLCFDPGEDRDAVENATTVANANDVVVSPIAAGGSSQCVILLAGDLAAGTGGIAFLSSEAGDMAGAITEMVEEVCRLASDCNGNKTPDECELADGTATDCDVNGVLDECDIRDCPDDDPSCQDCNTNDLPDWCDIDGGTSVDCQPNGIPDECDGGCE